MEDRPCYLNDFAFDLLITLPALVHVRHVVLLAEHLVIELIVGSLNDLIADTANLLCLLNQFINIFAYFTKNL